MIGILEQFVINYFKIIYKLYCITIFVSADRYNRDILNDVYSTKLRKMFLTVVRLYSYNIGLFVLRR